MDTKPSRSGAPNPFGTFTNPFAPVKSSPLANPFNNNAASSTSSASSNSSGSNPFAQASNPLAPISNPFTSQKPTPPTFGNNSQSTFLPTGNGQTNNGFGNSVSSATAPPDNNDRRPAAQFGNPLSSATNTLNMNSSAQTPSQFGNGTIQDQMTNTTNNGFLRAQNATGNTLSSFGANTSGVSISPGISGSPEAINGAGRPSLTPSNVSARGSQPYTGAKSQLALENEALLRKKNIHPPPWPTDQPGDPRYKADMDSFWQSMKDYRVRVRATLIASGRLDDPDKPKRLEDAIDFKGTCEEMCPEFEKVTRINEHDVQGPEKELAPDGRSMWPSTRKMVKALARSAAGQDAPLPEDIRSPAALRRTLNYLIGDVLGANELSTIHSFLWDRTRAIRRDFVFLQASINADELRDQVYCLETITRFHVVSLHQMMKPGPRGEKPGPQAEGFSEQQEVEQLGKTLLSLIQTYEDCALQQVQCDNEAEFRAYYVVFNGQNPGILENVQDWGYGIWEHAGGHIKTAVHLVETMQNTWDDRGPLRPHQATDIAQNAYGRFFTILKDRKVSYIMACFAEIHFNKVRKATFKTLIASNRRAKADPKDWNLSALNQYLHFDDDEEVQEFGEEHNVQFVIGEGDDLFLSLQSSDRMDDPEKRMQQAYSVGIVECKRGNHSLPDVILRTVYATQGAAAQDQAPWSGSSLTKQVATSERFSTMSVQARPNAIEPVKGTPTQKRPPAPPFINGFQISSKPSMFAPKQPQAKIETRVSSPPSLLKLSTPVKDTTSFPIQGSRETADQAGRPVVEPPKLQFLPSSTPNTEPLLPQVSTQPTVSQTSPLSLFPGKTATGQTKPFSRPTFPDTAAPPALTPVSVFTSTVAPVSAPPQSLLPPSSPSPPSPPTPPIDGFKSINQWVVEGEGGIIDMFTEWTVNNLLRDVYQGYKAEEAARLAQEEHERLEVMINQFRYRSLATKYGYMWREKANQKWLRRKGREDRMARRRMAEESARVQAAQLATKQVESDNIVDDFRATARKDMRRQETQGRTVINAVPSPNRSLATQSTRSDGAIQEQRLNISKRRHGDGLLRSGISDGGREATTSSPSLSGRLQMSTHGLVGTQQGRASLLRSVSSSNHKRNIIPMVPDDSIQVHHRRFSDSTQSSSSDLRSSKMTERMTVRDIMIQGFNTTSRIGLIPNYDPKLHDAKKAHGVQSPYFRHKARGLLNDNFGASFSRSSSILRKSAGSTLEDAWSSKPLSAFERMRDLAQRHPIGQAAGSVLDAENVMETQRSNRWRSSLTGVELAQTASKCATKPVMSQSVPANPVSVAPSSPAVLGKNAEVEEAKARARKVMGRENERIDQHKRKKRMSDVTDEELFANAKRVREQMDEGASWFREQRQQIERGSSRDDAALTHEIIDLD